MYGVAQDRAAWDPPKRSKVLTLDELMGLLADMRKIAAGLSNRDVVVRALHWLTTNDTVCSYLPESAARVAVVGGGR